jgi:hypothetical protein
VIKSKPGIIAEQGQYQVDVRIGDVGHSMDVEKDRLLVAPEFHLVAHRAAESASPPSLLINATFILEYEISSASDLADEQFRAFARTNGIYNAWPYWREYVQSTTARMGLPPIMIPVFRL